MIKCDARSIGPYSLITQQPLGGKASVWWTETWRDGSLEDLKDMELLIFYKK